MSHCEFDRVTNYQSLSLVRPAGNIPGRELTTISRRSLALCMMHAETPAGRGESRTGIDVQTPSKNHFIDMKGKSPLHERYGVVTPAIPCGFAGKGGLMQEDSEHCSTRITGGSYSLQPLNYSNSGMGLVLYKLHFISEYSLHQKCF